MERFDTSLLYLYTIKYKVIHVHHA